MEGRFKGFYSFKHTEFLIFALISSFFLQTTEKPTKANTNLTTGFVMIQSDTEHKTNKCLDVWNWKLAPTLYNTC